MLAYFVCIHLFFYIAFYYHQLIASDREFILGAVLVFSLISFLLMFQMVLDWFPQRFLKSFLYLTLLVVMMILLEYRLIRGDSLDFSLLFENSSEVVSGDGLRIILKSGGLLGVGFILMAFAAAVFLEWKYKKITNFYRPKKFVLMLWLALAGINSVFLATFSQNQNELFTFLKSAKRFLHSPEEAIGLYAGTLKTYPLLQKTVSGKPVSKSAHPHVFLVMLESFGSRYIEARDDEGREITPFFNSLISKGFYTKHFFSNSMQTARGQVATLCSVTPSYKQKIMTRFKDNHFKCLPKVMADVGYQTAFLQGQTNLQYDGTGTFMTKIGFQTVMSMDRSLLTPEEMQSIWGWGVEDRLLYKRGFQVLDALKSDPNRPTDAPLFATFATISNHQLFDSMPADQKYLYPTPENFEESFKNSIHLTDIYLRSFFDELEARPEFSDSIVILLGDHGFPTNEHSITSNERAFYNELFAVPLLILWPKKIKPWRNETVAYSQLDIMPTVMSWLDIRTLHHSRGVPLPYKKENLSGVQHSIPIIQPYDGIYLENLVYPWKYVVNVASEAEYLFNLESDPHEADNLIEAWKVGDLKVPENLREGVRDIYINQKLLNENRIFPPENELQTYQ